MMNYRNVLGLFSLSLVWLFVQTPVCHAGFQVDVSVSADGKTLATSQNRVIYLLDAETLKVTRRIWNEAIIKSMSFAEEGTSLVLRDDGRRLRFLDAATGKYAKTIENVSKTAFAPRANLVAAVSGKKFSQEQKVLLLDMTTGAEKLSVPLPKGFKVSAMALSAEGKKLVVVSSDLEGKEEKLPRDKWPKTFESRLAEKEFSAKSDGKHSEVLTFDTSTGKQLSKTESWYVPDREALAFFDGTTLRLMQYGNPCATISEAGEVKAFMSPAFCNYGLGWSADGGTYLAGGLAEGYRVTTGKDPIKFAIPTEDRLPGWPEYFNGFGVGADGVAYGVTSGGRIARISKEGKLLEIVPFF